MATSDFQKLLKQRTEQDLSESIGRTVPPEKEARANIKLMADVNPEQEARTRRLATSLGFKPALVRGAEDQAKRLELEKKTTVAFAKREGLINYLKDMDNAALSHDDIDRLSKVEDTLKAYVPTLWEDVRDTARNFTRTTAKNSLGSLRIFIDQLAKRGVSLPSMALAEGTTPDEIRASLATMTPEEMTEQIKIDPKAFEGIQKALAEEIAHPDWEPIMMGPQKSGLRQFGLDLEAGALQLGTQLYLNAIPIVGTGLSTTFMGSQIAGDTYNELLDAGVSDDRAALAAVLNAAVQTPMERLSLGRITKKLPGAGTASRTLKHIFEGAVVEGLTETAQSFPDELIRRVAKAEVEGKSVSEVINEFVSDIDEIGKQALYEGAIGFLLGGGAAGLHLTLQGGINQAESNEFISGMDQLLSDIEETQTKGRSPEAFEQFLQASRLDNEAYMTADGVNELYQSNPELAEQIFKKSGLDPKEVIIKALQGEAIKLDLNKSLSYLQAEELAQIKDDLKPSPGTWSKKELDSKVFEDEMARVKQILDSGKQLSLENQTALNEIGAQIRDIKSPNITAQQVDDFLNVFGRMAAAFNWDAEQLRRVAFKAAENVVQGGRIEQGERALTQVWQTKLTPEGQTDFNLQAELDAVQLERNEAGQILAPNGQVSNLDEYHAKLTRTPAFKNWFGESEVVDENGEPLVVYHGTKAANIETFKIKDDDYSMYGGGVYFTPDKALAEGYGDQVYPVYLSIKNPLKVGSKDWSTFLNKPSGQTKRDFLLRKGYDGIIDIKDKYKQILVISPTQIKSVYNRGTFDPNDPRIMNQTPIGDLTIGGGSDTFYQLDEQKWREAPQELDIFGTVNNRLSKELEVVERLLGPLVAADQLPGKQDAKGKRQPTRTIRARDLGAALFAAKEDGRLQRLVDPKVDPEELAKERGLKGKEKTAFLKELVDLRSGPLYMDEDAKGKPLLSQNGKATASIDLILGTCQPTAPCQECYAAASMIRMSNVKKAIRSTIHMIVDPKDFGRRVAEEAKRVPKSKLPFIRLLGSGDLTSDEAVEAFNEIAKHGDRPIHIFSRHHDNLAKLKGTAKAPFIKMGSIDAQLFEHYGPDFLAENLKKRGINNAWLYTNEAEKSMIQELKDRGALGLVLSAGKDLHVGLPTDLRAVSCPCDADERSYMGSCRQCALSLGGCFTSFADKAIDDQGRVWDLDEKGFPKKAQPVLSFLKGFQPKEGTAHGEAYAQVVGDVIGKSIELINLYTRQFKKGEADSITLKDIRWPEDQIRLIDKDAYKKKNGKEGKDTESTFYMSREDVLATAAAEIERLQSIKDRALKEGTFYLPGGEIQKPVAYKAWEKQGQPELISKEDAQTLYQSPVEQVDERSENFKKWSKGYEVLTGLEIADTKADGGKVFKVFHGTTHAFDVFDPTIKGNKEGQFGAVNYFTSDRGDADINYAGEGPDLTNRIEQRKEQIEYELEDISEDEARELAAKYGLEFDPETETYPEGLPEALAREELSGGEPQTMEVYVRLDNPAYIGGYAETWIENSKEAQYREDAEQEIADENDVSVEEAKEEYGDEIQERIYEMAAYDEPEIFVALQQALNEADTDVDAQTVYGELDIDDSEITATELEKKLRKSETLSVAWDRESGALIQSHIIGQVFKNLGFDGIVLQNANERFSGMDMGSQTAHIHVFEETPEQIKSTENQGTFDPNDPRIMYQPAYHGTHAANILKFSLDKIGTGKGAQSYGWGLYFTSNRDIAEWYKATLSAQKQTKGQVYKVDIPENEELLDWSASLSNQSATVKSSLDKLVADIGGPDLALIPGSDMTGRDIYLSVAEVYKGQYEGDPDQEIKAQSQASKVLNQYGIKGTVYETGSRKAGQKMDRNFVIFDDNAIDILDMFYQSQKQREPRGKLTIQGNQQYMVELFEKGDISTLLHETGHIFLNEMEQIISTGAADDQMRKDWTTIRNWLKVEPGQALETKHHEQFARGFEAYLFEGKAPNSALAEAFARFRQWLKQIYHDMVNLNVKLTDPVRNIFDRMLMAEQEIQTAALETQIAPLTAEQMKTIGVLPEDRKYLNALYKKALVDAEEEMVHDRNLNGKALRQQWKEDAQKQVDADPVFKIIDDLSQKGEGLNREEFIDTYGADAVAMLPSPKILKKNGISLRDAALLYDYEDHSHLVSDILSKQSKAEEVAKLVAQMQQDHDAQFKAEDYLVTTDAYADYLAIINRYYAGEIKNIRDQISPLAETKLGRSGATVLTKKTPAVVTRQAYNKMAERILQALPVSDAIQVNRYVSAMKNATAKEHKAASKGDFKEAARFNELARLNFAKAGQAVKNARETAKIERRLKRIETSIKKNPGKLDAKHRDHILDLLHRFGLTSIQPLEPNAMGDLNSLIAGDQGREDRAPQDPFFASDAMLNTNIRSYKTLAMMEFVELDNLIGYLKTHGTPDAERVLRDGRKKADVAATMTAETLTIKSTKGPGGKRLTALRKLIDVSRKSWALFDALPFIMASAGGYQNVGRNAKISQNEIEISEALGNASAEENAIMEDIHKGLNAHLITLIKWSKKMTAKYGSEMRIGVPTPQILKDDGQMDWWSPVQLLNLALNRGNESNLSRVFSGFESTETGAPQFTMTEYLKLMDYLGKEEWDAIQAIWDTNEKLNVSRKEVFKRLNGYPAESIEPKSFSTKYGTYKGGYSPIRYDIRLSDKNARTDRIAALHEKEDLMKQESVHQIPFTKSGFNRRRTATTPYPLAIDSLGHIVAGMGDVAHYITHAEVVRDADALIRDADYKNAVVKKLGIDVYNKIRPAIAYAANTSSVRTANRDVTRAAALFRGMATARILGLNAKTSIKQVFSSFSAINKLGLKKYSKAYLRSAWRLATSPTGFYREQVQFMTDSSKYMRERAGKFEYEMRTLFNGLSPDQKVAIFGDTAITWDKVANLAFFPIQFADACAVVPLWNGTYREYMNEHKGDSDAHEKAVREADNLIRLTQPSSQNIDRTEWQRTSPMLAMFGTYTIGKYQQRVRFNYRALKAGAIGKGEYTRHIAYDIAAPAILMNLLFAGLYGVDWEDEDTWADLAIDSAAQMVTPALPFVGNLLNPYGYEGSLTPPAFEAIDEVTGNFRKAARTIIEGDIEESIPELLWGVAEGISFAYRVPATRLVKTTSKGIEQFEDTGNPAALLVPAPKKR